MRRFHFIAIAVLTAFGMTHTALPQPPSPPLAQLKAAAEAGDPQAQDKLGDVFYLHQLDPEHAVIWYRKAAASGITNSQYQLAHILIGWARSPMAKKEASAMHADEAIPLFIKTANRGTKMAQVELGQIYEEGRFVTQDLVEAYKWYCLAAPGTPFEPAATLGKIYRDRLILKMTQSQIAAGDKLVAAFAPNSGQFAPMPEPSYVRQIRLTGLSGEPPRRLAMINGKTLGAGESATLKLDGRSVVIRCVSITQDAATIAVEGTTGTKELRLRFGTRKRNSLLIRTTPNSQPLLRAGLDTEANCRGIGPRSTARPPASRMVSSAES